MFQGQSQPPPRAPIRILLVDDDPVDVAFTRAALQHAGLANELSVAKDGIDALARLRGEGPHAHLPRPHMLLLDLEMPRMGGRELLRELRSDETLRTLPVVVLTSAEEMREQLSRECHLDPSRFLVKPLAFDTFVRAIASIPVFGLRIRRVTT